MNEKDLHLNHVRRVPKRRFNPKVRFVELQYLCSAGCLTLFVPTTARRSPRSGVGLAQSFGSEDPVHRTASPWDVYCENSIGRLQDECLESIVSLAWLQFCSRFHRNNY